MGPWGAAVEFVSFPQQDASIRCPLIRMNLLLRHRAESTAGSV